MRPADRDVQMDQFCAGKLECLAFGAAASRAHVSVRG